MQLPKILIVDDEAGIRSSIRDYLALRMECVVFEATNGYEALAIFQKDPIDLLLLDMRMPGISGTDVIKKAREQSKDVPIIVISAWEGEAVARHVEECGANDYVPKPFSLKIVCAKVTALLKKSGKFFPKQG